MILKENFVHGDLHPGNILWCQKDNRLAFIDNGIVIELEDNTHSDIVGTLRAMAERRGSDAARAPCTRP